MASDDDHPPDRRTLRSRLRSLQVGDAAELLVLARERIRQSPVEHAKAAADATAALAQAKTQLPPAAFAEVRSAVLQVARRDWTAAAQLAEQLPVLARRHPEEVAVVGEAVARAVSADRTLARQLARELPRCAAEVADPTVRRRIVASLSDLCRRHPGLGLAALPSVARLLSDGTPLALAEFLEEALQLAAGSESVARSFLLRESRLGQETWDEKRNGLALTEVARSLALYAEAHAGRPIVIRSISDLPATIALLPGALAVTDGATVWLSPRLDRFDDPEKNFLLYKIALAHEVGRIEFGTFSLDPFGVRGLDPEVIFDGTEGASAGSTSPVLQFVDRFPDAAFARRLFLFAEDLRIDACLRRDYPGLGRDIEAMGWLDMASRPDIDSLKGVDQALELLARRLWFGELLPTGETFRRYREAAALLEALRHPSARVADSAASTVILYRLFGGDGQPGSPPLPNEGAEPWVALAFLRGGRTPEGAGEEIEADPSSEGGEAGEPASETLSDPSAAWWGAARRPRPAEPATGARLPAVGGSRLASSDIVPPPEAGAQAAQLERARQIQRTLDARGVLVSLRELLDALRMDPEISDLALARDLSEAFRETRTRAGEPTAPLRDVDGESDAPAQVSRYPEWDEQISDYRPRWVSVWERRASGNAGSYVDAVLQEHGELLGRLRREFQLLRPRGLGVERRAREGEALDLDALLDEVVDARLGRPGDGRVYLRRVRRVRDVAVAFLVDQSASTRELVSEGGKSVIEVEKDALILLSEALEAVGDRYAVFGFSGRGRHAVTFETFKDFDEPLDASARGRIGAMSYRMENRDGAAIRHATQRLAALDARVRLLVLLSDGKPLDCGCDLYQASYAQADTRMALREAREYAVHPFCITVDPFGDEYLGAMYGDVRYTVIDSVAQLPARLPAIYRRLTT